MKPFIRRLSVMAECDRHSILVQVLRKICLLNRMLIFHSGCFRRWLIEAEQTSTKQARLRAQMRPQNISLVSFENPRLQNPRRGEPQAIPAPNNSPKHALPNTSPPTPTPP